MDPVHADPKVAAATNQITAHIQAAGLNWLQIVQTLFTVAQQVLPEILALFAVPNPVIPPVVTPPVTPTPAVKT